MEKWTASRKDAENRTVEKVAEKRAEIVADNAVMLEQIKTKLLQKLDAMVDAYPDANAQEIKRKQSGALLTYRMRDIAAVYAALEDKTTRAGGVDLEDLSPLGELLRDE